jgi:hypothetical protein
MNSRRQNFANRNRSNPNDRPPPIRITNPFNPREPTLDDSDFEFEFTMPETPVKNKKHEKTISIQGNTYRESMEDEPNYKELRRMNQDTLEAQQIFNEQKLKNQQIMITPTLQQQQNDYRLQVNQQNLDVIKESNKKAAISTLKNQQMIYQNPVSKGSKKEKARRMTEYYDEIIEEILAENGKRIDRFDPMTPNIYHGHESNEVSTTQGYIETIIITGTSKVMVDNENHCIAYKFPTSKKVQYEDYGKGHHAFHHKASEFIHIFHIQRYGPVVFDEDELDEEHQRKCRLT